MVIFMKKMTLIGVLIFLIDRIIKIIISSSFELNVRNEVIDEFFYITNCHNEGAAFSLFSGSTLFLILITLFVIFFIYKSLNKKDISSIQKISYGILLGGILGNLYDRVFLGYVIDYLDFVIFKFDFAIFNFADICILMGTLMVIFFEGSDNSGRKNISNS